MQLRKLALAVGMTAALGADVASALGLGEIKLKSTLNQPLDAEIKLLNIKNLTQDEILVSLGSKQDFNNAGVERLYFLTGLKFEVDISNPASPKVRVSTRKPVTEPYLNFVVESQWPSGRLLREYTLLMDLPTFETEAVRPIKKASSQPSSQPSSQREYSQSRPSPSSSQPQSRSRSSSASQSGSVYGPVSGSDTLWSIALQSRPDRSLSVQQVMLAIQRENPEAFINGNINLLRKGSVLRIPDRDTMVALSNRQAVTEVAEQNREWSGTTGAQLEGSRNKTRSKPEAKAVEGRVRLAADSTESNAGTGSGGSGRGEQLENELAISLEELDKSKRDNDELQSRVRELEEQIATMERLIDVSNNEMRQMQLAQERAAQELEKQAQELELAQQQASASSPKEQASSAPEPVSQPEIVQSPVSQPPAQQAEVVQPEAEPPKVAEPVAAPKPETPAKKQRVVRPAPKPEPSLIDLLMDNIIFVAGGAVALLGGLVLFLRRRKDEEEFEFDESDELESHDVLLDDSDVDLGDELTLDDPEEEAFAEEGLDLDSVEDSLPEETSAEAETGDVVGEADIYIAYGKFDQAEEMLAKAIVAGGASAAVYLKMLEVHSETQALDKFDETYRGLLTLGDNDANHRAENLRSGFVDAPDFDAGEHGSSPQFEAHTDTAEESNTEVADLETDELSLDDDLLESTVEATSDDATVILGDLDLSDDVTESDDVLEALSLETEAEGEALSDELSLDLDLDAELDSADGSDLDSELLDLDLDLDTDVAETDLDLDLDLDLELPDELSSDEPLAVTEDDLALNLDLNETESPANEQELSEQVEEEGLSLDLSADASDDLGELSEDLELSLDTDLELPEGLDNDLDLELPDLDMASLDSEIGDLDDSLSLDESLNLENDASGDDLSLESEALDLSVESLEVQADELESDGTDLEEFVGGDSADLTLENASPEAEVPELTSEDALETSGDLDLGVSDDLESLDLETSDENFASLDLDSEELDLPDLDSVDLDMSLDDELSADLAELDSSVESLASNDELSPAGDIELKLDESSEDLADIGEDFMAALDESLDGSEDLDLGDLEALDAELNVDDLGGDLPTEDLEAFSEELDLPAEQPPELEVVSDASSVAAPESGSDEDSVFDEALSDVPDLEGDELSLDDLPESTPESLADDFTDDIDSELDFLADADEVATKLDLARAYIDMGDADGAKDILDEVLQEGSDEQKSDAQELLTKLS